MGSLPLSEEWVGYLLWERWWKEEVRGRGKWGWYVKCKNILLNKIFLRR